MLSLLPDQQLIHIGVGVTNFFPLLVEFELVQADVGNFIGEVFFHPNMRQ